MEKFVAIDLDEQEVCVFDGFAEKLFADLLEDGAEEFVFDGLA